MLMSLWVVYIFESSISNARATFFYWRHTETWKWVDNYYLWYTVWEWLKTKISDRIIFGWLELESTRFVHSFLHRIICVTIVSWSLQQASKGRPYTWFRTIGRQYILPRTKVRGDICDEYRRASEEELEEIRSILLNSLVSSGDDRRKEDKV